MLSVPILGWCALSYSIDSGKKKSNKKDPTYIRWGGGGGANFA